MRPDRGSEAEIASHILHAIRTPLLDPRFILSAAMALIRSPIRFAQVVVPLVCQGRIIGRLKNIIIVPKALRSIVVDLKVNLLTALSITKPSSKESVSGD